MTTQETPRADALASKMAIRSMDESILLDHARTLERELAAALAAKAEAERRAVAEADARYYILDVNEQLKQRAELDRDQAVQKAIEGCAKVCREHAATYENPDAHYALIAAADCIRALLDSPKRDD